MARRAIAVDLGGTRVRAGLVAEDGRVVMHREAPTPAQDGPDAVLGQIAALVAAVRQAAGSDAVPVIGVSAPGPLDTATGVVCTMQSLDGFDGLPLRDELERRLGAPVALENDGIAGALGEWRFGAGRGTDDLLYVTLSTGIGGGIIAGGRPLRGRRGLAGHVGHIFFAAGWERRSGGHMPCFEDFASGTALAARAREAAAGDPGSVLHAADRIDAAAVLAAAAKGDGLARRLVADEAAAIGTGLASLAHVLDPALIVLGGGLAQALPVLEAGILAAFGQNAKPGFEGIALAAAALGTHSSLCGAAALAFDPALAAGRG
ncbi:MAG: ROK family protein [Rhodobacteraceae bacterium]|nr:ROK family protein [Paracoccaceae bacterium]